MNFLLAKDQKVVFYNETLVNKNNVCYRTVSFQTTWQNGEASKENGNTNLQQPAEICNKFARLVRGKTLQLEVGMNNNNTFHGTNIVKARISGDDCLQKINSTALSEGLVVSAVLEIKNWRACGDPETNWIHRARTESTRISAVEEEVVSAVEWNEMLYSNVGTLGLWTKTSHDFEGELEIVLTFGKIACGCPLSAELKEFNLVYRNILNEKIAADISIIPGSGASIKCHRALILNYCPKFESQIKGTFGDPTSNSCEIPELTENGVRALLNYMYLNDTTTAGENCGVALELYLMSEKYEMKRLRDKLRGLLTEKPDSWYEVDMLMKFYMVTKSAAEDVELKRRVVDLIKANKNSIIESESFLQFIKDDPVGVAELFGLVLD